MKFRCERDTLVEALATASRAVTTRSSTSPALGGVRVGVEGNRLTVVGTDLDLTVRVEVEAIGLDDGACVAPARLTADIVRSLEPGAVTFEGGEEEVEISAARSPLRGADLSGGGLPGAPRPPASAGGPARRRSGRGAAPGGAGRLQRRRPTPAHRRPGGGRGRRDPAGGHRLLPAGPPRPRRDAPAARGDRADPGARPGAHRAPAPAARARAARTTARPRWGSRSGELDATFTAAACTSPPACSTAGSPTTAS